MDWFELPLIIPTDAQEVWVRLQYYAGTPFLAVWDNTAKTFTDSVNGIVYPAWIVSRWRAQ